MWRRRGVALVVWQAVVMLAWLLPAVVWGECPAEPEELTALLAQSQQAYLDLDGSRFDQVGEQVKQELECLRHPLDSRQAQEYHLFEALSAYLARDEQRAIQAFAAVLFIDPLYELDERIAPLGNPLRDIFLQAGRYGVSPRVRVLTSSKAALYLDGEPSLDRPAELPVVMQWVKPDGTLLWSGYLPAGSVIPGSLMALLTEDDPLEFLREETGADALVALAGGAIQDETGAAAPGHLGAWGRSSVGVAALSAGLLSAALVQRALLQRELQECGTTGECLLDAQAFDAQVATMTHRANALGYTGQVAGGVAVGLGLVAWVGGRW